ncbi:MAG: histidinol-phosphate aminotransferase family protein [Hyphomicrobiales bacterium]|nr:histidinol-phosphate aminotransferase family protein [Hyphomicrobiales bacterium]
MKDTPLPEPGNCLWTADFDWPFGKPPPTRDHLASQGKNPDAMHLLGLNEAPLAPSGRVAGVLSQAAEYLNRYPDNIHEQLTKAVEKIDGVPVERQIWGSGAGELINRAVAVATNAGLNIVSMSPTFWGYERVYALHDANVHRTGLHKDGSMDVDALLAAIDGSTGIVTFATPGNPSGVSLSEEEIVHIARKTPDNVLLMVDEVYYEFCAHEGGPNALEILKRERTSPWLVLRSFSKAYRLAGARVGYGFASDAMTARRIREHSLNFTISTIGFVAALASFEDRAELERYLAQNAAVKKYLTDSLASIGANPFPSAANFVSARLSVPAAEAAKALLQQNIVCAAWNHPDFPNNLRIGVGSMESADAVCNALKPLLG